MEENIHLFSFLTWIQHRIAIISYFDSDELLNPRILREIILRFTNECVPKIENYLEVLSNLRDINFKQHFRISRSTFETIMNYLGPFWDSFKRNEEEGGNEQISLHKSLLISLWVLATPDSYRSVAERFGVCKSTVYKCLIRNVYLINIHLCPKFIKLPSPIDKIHNANHFEARYNFPNVIGCIDGCHIPIRRPSQNGNDYFNRKKFYSVVLQGICRYDLSFMDVDCRWPGSVHDARVFRTSPVFEVLEELCSPNFFLIGDSAYPCSRWLICPLRNNGMLTDPQKHFNTTLSKTRVAIENAFALLKGRFRRLKYLEMYDLEELVNTVICCCTLHNICIAQNEGDEFIQEGLANVERIHDAIDYHVAANEEDNARGAVIEYLWQLRNPIGD